MATREEVKQEMIRRGLLPAEGQSQGPSHEQIRAEMSRRGLLPEQQTNPSLPLRVGADVLAGAAQFGQGIQNAPRNLAEKFVPSLAQYTPERTDINFGQMFGVKNPNWLDKLLQGSVQYAPYAIAAGPSLLANVLGGAVGGATQERDPLLGAMLGTVGGAAGYGAGKAIGALPKGYQIAKNYLSKATPKAGTPESQFAAQAGELPIPYAGQKLYEKGLANIPFSGVEKNVEKIGDAAQETADSILENLKGPVSESEIPSSVVAANKANRKLIKETSNKKYEDLGKMAEEQGITVDETPNLNALANIYLKQNKKGSLNLPDKLVNHLEDLTKLNETKVHKQVETSPVFGTIERTQKYKEKLPFNELHKMKKEFLEIGRRSERSNPAEAKIFNDLGKAAKNDMNLTADKSGNPDFINGLNEADEHYATHVVPHRSPLGRRLSKKTQNLETLANNFLTGSEHANKLLNDLPRQAKNQIGYLKLKSAIKEMPGGKYEAEPQKLVKAYNNLSERQKQELFDPLTRAMFNRLGMLAQYSKPLGKQAGKIGALEIGTPILEALSMHPVLALKTGGLSALMTLGARGATKALTDPRLRNAYLASIGQSNMSIDPAISAALRAAGMGGAMGGNQ